MASGEHTLTTPVAPDAAMCSPGRDLEWILRYGDAAAARYGAACVVASFNYLLDECTEKELLRRVRLIKKHRREVRNEAGER